MASSRPLGGIDAAASMRARCSLRLMPLASLADERRSERAHISHTAQTESDAMRGLPTACPECTQPGVTYSTGVIPCVLGIGHDYPVVRCGHCHHDFVLPPPYTTWQRCQVHTLMAFTKDPDAIDRTITMWAYFDPRAGRGWYVLPPASQGERRPYTPPIPTEERAPAPRAHQTPVIGR
jgi:hypothetical protein